MLKTSGILNHSLITSAPPPLDAGVAFGQGARIIQAILESFGIGGVSCGTSDVAVGSWKIYGNAQTWRWKSLLLHGTLLVDLDLDLAERILRYPPCELDYRRGRGHRDFLITLRQLGISASRNEVEQAALHAAERLYSRVPTHKSGE